MRVLGISAYYHDSAAALVEDGRIVAAAQEERFTRKKHDSGFPHRAVEYCLSEAGVPLADVDRVVFYDKLFLKRLLQNELKALAPDYDWATRLLFCEHHLSHAASAFYPSPFDDAVVLTMDGVGEWTTTSIGVGRGRSLQLVRELQFPHSLGLL